MDRRLFAASGAYFQICLFSYNLDKALRVLRAVVQEPGQASERGTATSSKPSKRPKWAERKMERASVLLPWLFKQTEKIR